MGSSSAAHLAGPGEASIIFKTKMSFRATLFLFILGIFAPIVIAQYQPIPGYLDSDYYYAGGIQLASGRGFTEPYLWNYLDGSTSLPHPSHGYWMPLASIIAALGMWITDQTTYASARILFIVVAGLVPPVTAALAYSFSKRRDLSITSGLLAVFSVYHAPFVGVTDNFGLFMLFGGLYFMVATRLMSSPKKWGGWLLLGSLAGLLSLSRSDGLLWLALAFLFALWRTDHTAAQSIANLFARNLFLVLLGFLIVMSPWYMRNFGVYGAFMAPGGSRTLWLDHYDQMFIFPPTSLTLTSFLSLGWQEIILDRLWALGLNLQSGFAAHGGIILFPFIVAGIVAYRRDDRVKLAGLAWFLLFLVMTFIFPFAGARGAFFHAGAALQPMWWSLAPLGLESVLIFLRKRGWGNDHTRIIFRSALVMVAMIITVYVVYLRLFALGWGEGEENYSVVEHFLVAQGIEPDDIVIVRNAPGYFLETGRSALAIPYGGEQAILDVSQQFGARYLVVEPEAALKPIESLFENPRGHSRFVYLGEINESRIYKIEFE